MLMHFLPFDNTFVIMTEADFTSTTDAQIRGPLLTWLRKLHTDDYSAKMFEEFKIPRPSARIDVAVVNGEMTGFEIKSDRDKLNRLSSQVPAFSRVFDRVTLVTTDKHLSLAKTKIPKWWGILVFSGDNDFSVLRSSRTNKNVDTESFLYTLSKYELGLVGIEVRMPLGKALKKDEMVKALLSSVKRQDIHHFARDVIRQRISM